LNAQPSVTLTVLKQSGTNTVATSDAVKQRLEEIKKTLPKDIVLRPVNDQSVFIRAAVNAIKQHLVEGSLLAALIIFAFLANWRTTLIAAVAIPTSIVSTFAFVAAMGFTLNQITMLALTLMVGVVIDDAIIVLENIYRHIEEKGMKPFEAAVEGTREIGLAVMATTLSLLAVFLPIGFMGGIMGRFLSSFGFTCAFAVAVSLLVSFTLTPMLSARFLRADKPRESSKKSSKDSRFFRVLDRAYTAMLHWSLDHRKTMVALSTAVVFSIVPLFMFTGKSFTPVDDRSEFQVSLRTAEGTSLAATTTVAERIARDIRALPGVTDTLTSVGSGSDEAVNRASIYVKLASLDQRSFSQQELGIKTREILARYPSDLRTSIGQANSNTGGTDWGAYDVQFAITGPDLDKLAMYSSDLVTKLKDTPKVADADTTLVYGKPELRVEIDRQRAADLGVRVSDIAQALNALIAGQVVSTFPSGGELYDVRLRAAQEFRTSTEELKQLTVASNKVGSVTLDQVVRVKPGTAPSNIDRINRQRQVTVNANVLPGGSQGDVLSKLSQWASDLHMDPGYGTATTGQSKELGRTAYYFLLAVVLTFIFMYMVLAAQFESFLHPLTILLTLPLAIPFGILSLMLAGQTINAFSGLGLLLLFGIVKKNAILQIDHTNGLLAKGMPLREAIIQANRDRLRPILMTTMALVAGMLPLVISHGTGSATNRSIGVLVVGGQSLCLLLTLLAVPVFYSIFEDMKEWKFFRKVTRGARAVRRRSVPAEALAAGEGEGRA
jgi:HAE1 family hydrophobic/amphiphilic exporter-1